MEAVAKYFRHKGLTVGGPKEAKGRATLSGAAPAPQSVNER